jgi:acyl-CoA oxidase
MPLRGITIGDCGKKTGMQGVDNGFIIFNDFRIPRTNLLNRFSDVTADGKFKAEIESADQRFALQLGALSTGRIMILFSCTVAMEMVSKIALRFAAMRQ